MAAHPRPMYTRAMRCLLVLPLVSACTAVSAGKGETGAPASGDDSADSAESAETAEAEEEPVAVVINELMADNDSTVEDAAGDEDDWVELVNRTDAAVDLSGWGLGQDADRGPLWTFPEGTEIAPGDHPVVWLDGELEEGVDHTAFSLDSDGDVLVLFDAQGAAADTWTFDEQRGDTSLGRFPDGDAWVSASVYPTPGNANPYDPGLETDPSAALFPEDEVLQIELWIPEDSASALASQPYENVVAALGFGGVWLEPVALHIKGVYGSLRNLEQKAAFKIDLDEYLPGQRLRGLEHLTLNNMVQDPSCVHETLAYELFRGADVPAPRTAYVALTLNGEYRGLYLNVESEDDQFLQRWFDDPNGNLYEGAYGPDVTSGSYGSLELDEQGADDVTDRSDLAALAALLDQAPSEALVPDLEALTDLDRNLRMWAGEVMLSHWDGYFYYPNNYRIYHEPSTGQFTLIPWGTDQTFSSAYGIYDANGYLAVWALQIPSVKERYKLALWEMADRMRDPALLARGRAAQTLLLPWWEADTYREYDSDTQKAYYQATLDYIDSFPEGVVGQLFPDGEP